MANQNRAAGLSQDDVGGDRTTSYVVFALGTKGWWLILTGEVGQDQ